MDAERIRILCVADDSDEIETLSRIFKQNGIHSETVFSLDEALEVLEEKSFNLIITSITTDALSDMSPWMTIQKKAPDAKLIIITQSGSVTSYLNAHLLGVYDYFFKPVEPKVLARTINKALDA